MGATRTETNRLLSRVVELLEEIAAAQPALSYTPERASRLTGAPVWQMFKLIGEEAVDMVAGLEQGVVLVTHRSLARLFGGES